MAVTSITVDDLIISPSVQATHVGVVRNTAGNGSHISDRLSAHRRAVFGILHAGLAKGHRANTAACLRVESIYGRPVLLSGLASLVLSSKEENILDQHYKVHLQRLLKLHQSTPAPVIYFLAGCLPLAAQLHMRMLSLFGQLCRLHNGDNILAKHASYIYSSATLSSKSWFWRIRQLCLKYGLPHPHTWLSYQPSKYQVKSMVRTSVLEYWLEKLRLHADSLTSLGYLRTRFLGLTRCHPIFYTCGSSPYEVEKATTQGRLLSGRYRVETLTGHWIPWNKDGLCTLPECWRTQGSHKGTVEAFLLNCPSLASTRLALEDYVNASLQSNPELIPLVQECLAIDKVQFWLDCSTMPPIIAAVQGVGECVLYSLFKITRNYCHKLHKARMSLLENIVSD